MAADDISGSTLRIQSCTNESKYFLNVDEVTLYNEGDACGFIDIPVIEITIDNYYICISHYMSKQYINRSYRGNICPHYLGIMVIYLFPLFGVIFMMILHVFIINTTLNCCQIITQNSHFG